MVGWIPPQNSNWRVSDARYLSRSETTDVLREEKLLLSRILRKQARFSLEVLKDDQR